ncbi:MAG TPA: bifunctional (p)ppGpp synthetase/guanosine-3',5'-bis(diphosphate) 3'-pyrophosphohydrolase [bacterium]|nr:bifunctional (p)ppGpp synthetase/guanosine-3',5'-bis(diphosphate) 3'-pyrophosphohydrolase [bacterium]
MEERYRVGLRNLIRKIRRYNSNFDVGLLRKAYEFSYAAHKDQLRRSGEAYFEHPFKVGIILADLRMDLLTICGGLLHDVAEDTGFSLDDVRDEFGNEMATLVNGVTKISELKFDSIEVRQAENFRKMIVSMVEDIRVILIKFADRLHNMRTLEFLPEKKQVRIARETLEVYAPLAHRLGIGRIKWELEDLAFKILYPVEYKQIVKKVADRRDERERYIQRISRPIRNELKKSKLESKIIGRPKHFYSIFNKMRTRQLPFEEIYDLLAIRIIVKRIEDCYHALGIVHSLFTPIHEKFNDYIATPKSNMYQSLHTKLIGPEGKTVEIQIRTEEMDRTAEEGIAAHWRYKEGRLKEDEFDKHLVWLRRVLEWQQDTPESKEFMEYLKIDLFHDEVFVFTPKGDLFRVPSGSTPIDFAYAVHTDIGYHCLGAKVNKKIVPLNYQLRSGDTIEIITSNNQHPNPDWINFVKTSKARSRIKRWIRDSMFEQSLKLGNEILTKELKRYKIKAESRDLQEISQSYGFTDINQLYAAIGRGEISALGIIHKLEPSTTVDQKSQSIFNRLLRTPKKTGEGVLVQGVDNLLLSFGKCCQPVPGDQILGFITKGKGVVIHRTDCKNIFTLLKFRDRIIEVMWDVEKDRLFSVRLYITGRDRRNLLKDITEVLSRLDVNIVNVDLKTVDSNIQNNMLIEVKNLNHLKAIMKGIKKINNVLSVDRITGNGARLKKLASEKIENEDITNLD